MKIFDKILHIAYIIYILASPHYLRIYAKLSSKIAIITYENIWRFMRPGLL